MCQVVELAEPAVRDACHCILSLVLNHYGRKEQVEKALRLLKSQQWNLSQVHAMFKEGMELELEDLEPSGAVDSPSPSKADYDAALESFRTRPGARFDQPLPRLARCEDPYFHEEGETTHNPKTPWERRMELSIEKPSAPPLGHDEVLQLQGLVEAMDPQDVYNVADLYIPVQDPSVTEDQPSDVDSDGAEGGEDELEEMQESSQIQSQSRKGGSSVMDKV